MPKDEPTQYTPKGLEIPIPTRETVDDALAKAAKPMVPDPNHPSSNAKRKRRGKSPR